MANQQQRTPALMGFLPATPTSVVLTQALSSAAGAGGWGLSYSQTGLAYSFIATGTQQISKIKVYASAVAGTLQSTDLVADLYSDTSGVPGTSIESRTSVTATPTGAAWVEFTGFTATSTLVAGTQYWIVLRNADVTPTVNFPTYRFGSTNTAPYFVHGTVATWGFNKALTTDGGTTWGTTVVSVVGWRIEFSDGSFIGIPIQNIAVVGTADYVYGTREEGVKLTTPANSAINIIGATFHLEKLGTPAQPAYFRLYSGSSSTPTRLISSGNIPVANISSATYNWYTAYFATPQTVSPSTTLRVVIGHNGAGGDTSNAYRHYTYTIDNTAASKALLGPSAAGYARTLSTDGTTFTDTDTEVISFGLLLDTNAEFPVVSSSSTGVIGG